jgi:UDP-glucuronate 4-epimerase
MHFIGCIEAALRRKAKMNFLPLQPGDVPKTYANVDALVAAVDFKPATPIEVGIERFVAWYRSFYG